MKLVPPPPEPAPPPAPAPPPRVPAPPPPPSNALVKSRKLMTLSAPAGSRAHTLACEDGRVVTGGWGSTFPGLILAMRPALDGTSFTVQNDSAGATTTHAICIERPAGYTVVQSSRTLAPRERALVDVTCPPNTVVIGGGASTEVGVYLAMSSPKLDGSAWSAYYRSDAIIGSKKADTFAVCASPQGAPGRFVESWPKTPVSIPPGGSSSPMYFGCGPGMRVLGIGYSVSTTLVKQPSFYPGENAKSSPPTEGWSGGLTNTSSFIDNVTLTNGQIVGICAKTAL